MVFQAPNSKIKYRFMRGLYCLLLQLLEKLSSEHYFLQRVIYIYIENKGSPAVLSSVESLLISNTLYCVIYIYLEN